MKILVVLSFVLSVKTVSSLYCFWNTGCPYKYFSSKTPYNTVRGDIRDAIVKLTDCEPISVWGLYRHGKRYPGPDFGKEMKRAIGIRDHVLSSYMKGNSSLCAQDIDNLREWKVDNRMFDQVSALAPEGHIEMVGIGSRLKQAFPNILNNLDKGSYTLRPAAEASIENSAKGFAEGFNKKLSVDTPKPDFDVMNPFVTCGKYQMDVRKNDHTYHEANKYLNTSDFLASKDRIQRRTGMDYILTENDIIALYDLCRYTWSGLESKSSPWCALFTSEDLQSLEYIGDLRHYYRNGYGTPLAEKFGQVVLADLLENFRNAKEGNGKKLTAYFTHATMLDMAYTALGLFKDDKPLTAVKRDSNRKWRASKFSVFGANLVAALNRCNKNGGVEYNVVFYLNEEPLIPICKEGVCTWDEFENKLKTFSETKIDFC